MKPCETCFDLVEGDCTVYGVLGIRRAMRLAYCPRNPEKHEAKSQKVRVGQQKSKKVEEK